MSIVIGETIVAPSMLLSELVAEVIARTGRPDKESMIRSYVRQATLQLHSQNDWNKDRRSFQHVFTTAANKQTFQLSDISDHRKLQAIKRLDADLNELEPELEPVSVSTMLDEMGMQRSEVWYYGAGTAVLVGAYAIDRVVFWYYQMPKIGVTDTTYDSWIAKEYPYAIIDIACRDLLAILGQQEVAARMDKIIAGHMHTLDIIDQVAIP